MDTLTKYILDSSNFDEWLKQNGLGWLMEQRFIEAWSTVIGAIIAYYIGRVLLKWGIKSVVRSTASRLAQKRYRETSGDLDSIAPQLLADLNDCLCVGSGCK